MGPTFAETARTLLSGRIPGVLRIAGRRERLDVVHATDCTGRPLLLVADDSETARVLADPSARDWPGVLTVDDVPPLDSSPDRGRAHAAGRVRRLDESELREAVLEFADANPVADLLDVGATTAIHRIEVDQVWLEVDGTLHEVDGDDYIVASPDPLHEEEKDLLLDLAGHHAAEIGGYLARCLEGAGVVVTRCPLPVRLDRHGFVVDPAAVSPPRWIRLDFPRPVRDRQELADLLHHVLFHGAPTP